MDLDTLHYFVGDILSMGNPNYITEEPEKSIATLVKHLQFIPKYGRLDEFKGMREKDDFLANFLYEDDYTKLLNLIDRTTIKYDHPNHYTPLMAIVCNQNICNFEKKMVMDRLLEMGERINTSNKNGDTALSMAVKREDEPMIYYLLKHNANPNTMDNLGVTPLMIATFNAQLYYMALLYHYGANLLDTCAIFDLDVADIAKMTKIPSVIEMLECINRH